MSGQNKLIAELIRGLKHERDELRLQLHLGRKELQEELQTLDDRLESLSHQYEPLKGAVAETADDVWEALKLVGSEIQAGFSKIRQAL